jgi:hypothetical protein
VYLELQLQYLRMVLSDVSAAAPLVDNDLRMARLCTRNIARVS